MLGSCEDGLDYKIRIYSGSTFFSGSRVVVSSDSTTLSLADITNLPQGRPLKALVRAMGRNKTSGATMLIGHSCSYILYPTLLMLNYFLQIKARTEHRVVSRNWSQEIELTGMQHKPFTRTPFIYQAIVYLVLETILYQQCMHSSTLKSRRIQRCCDLFCQ